MRLVHHMLPFHFLLSCRITGYWEKGQHSHREIPAFYMSLSPGSQIWSVWSAQMFWKTQFQRRIRRHSSVTELPSSLFPLICQMSISSTVQNKLYCIKLNYRIINNSVLLRASAMPHWNPSLLTSTFWGSVIRQSIFRSSAHETIRHFSATIQPKAEQLWQILKQSDRSNYHLPTSSAPTLMKSTTLQQTPYALKLTFTFVNN